MSRARRRTHFQVPSCDWNVGSDYEVIRLIWSGETSAICEANHLPTGERVAIKRISRVFESETCKSLLQELLIMKHLHHPNVVKIKSIIRPKDIESFNELYIVMEYAPSNLEKLLRSSIKLKEDHIQLIVYNLLCGLAYIQSANILHRDLQPANILFYDNCDVKICDFGLAISIPKFKNQKLINSKEGSQCCNKHEPEFLPKRRLTECVETNSYQAPEFAILEGSQGKSADIWSIGRIIAELCKMIQESAACEYEGESELIERSFYSPSDSGSSITQDSLDNLGYLRSQECNVLLKDRNNTESGLIYLVKSMMHYDPRKRITAYEALRYPYFDNIREVHKEIEANIELNFELEMFEDLGQEKIRKYLLSQIIKYN